MATVGALPSDVLLHVFAFACRTTPALLAAALVCRRWHALVFQAPLHLTANVLRLSDALPLRLPRCACLTLSGNPFTGGRRVDFPASLAAFTNLTELNLRDTLVNELSFSALTQLRRLHLPKRAVDRHGGVTPPHLRELWLNGAADQPLSMCSALLTLNLTGLNATLYPGTGAQLMPIAVLTNLRWLNLSLSRRLTAGDMGNVLHTLTTLEHLDVSGCVSIKSLGWVAPLRHLQTLNISSLSVRPTDLPPLKCLVRLRGLRMQFCSDVNDAGVTQIACLTALRELDARATGVTAQSQALFPNCKIILKWDR